MQRNTRSLVAALFAVALALAQQSGSKADSFSRAGVNGYYHLTSAYATGFNISAYSTYYAATGQTIPGGSVTISSNVLAVHAGVTKLVNNTIVIANVTYKHAVITTASFSFQGAMAHAVLELTACPAYGRVGFKIVRDTDGLMMSGSVVNGLYAQLPLEWGGVTILGN